MPSVDTPSEKGFEKIPSFNFSAREKNPGAENKNSLSLEAQIWIKLKENRFREAYKLAKPKLEEITKEPQKVSKTWQKLAKAICAQDASKFGANHKSNFPENWIAMAYKIVQGRLSGLSSAIVPIVMVAALLLTNVGLAMDAKLGTNTSKQVVLKTDVLVGTGARNNVSNIKLEVKDSIRDYERNTSNVILEASNKSGEKMDINPIEPNIGTRIVEVCVVASKGNVPLPISPKAIVELGPEDKMLYILEAPLGIEPEISISTNKNEHYQVKVKGVGLLKGSPKTYDGEEKSLEALEESLIDKIATEKALEDKLEALREKSTTLARNCAAQMREEKLRSLVRSLAERELERQAIAGFERNRQLLEEIAKTMAPKKSTPKHISQETIELLGEASELAGLKNSQDYMKMPKHLQSAAQTYLLAGDASASPQAKIEALKEKDREIQKMFRTLVPEKTATSRPSLEP